MDEIWFTLNSSVSPKAALFRQDHDKQATPLDADAQCTRHANLAEFGLTPLLISGVPVASAAVLSRFPFPASPSFRWTPHGADPNQVALPSWIDVRYTRVPSRDGRPGGSSVLDTVRRSDREWWQGVGEAFSLGSRNRGTRHSHGEPIDGQAPQEFARRRVLLPVCRVDRAPDERSRSRTEADRRRPDYARHRRKQFRSRVVVGSAHRAFCVPPFVPEKHHTRSTQAVG